MPVFRKQEDLLAQRPRACANVLELVFGLQGIKFIDHRRSDHDGNGRNRQDRRPVDLRESPIVEKGIGVDESEAFRHVPGSY